RLQRRRPGLSQFIQLAVYAPLVLSPVVSGLALVFFWGRPGLLGPLLERAGWSVAYTTLGVVVVQVFVALPFVVATAVTALRSVPDSVQDAAAVDGANRSEVLRLVILPIAWPGIAVGLVLAFARSLGEYGATLTFAGNVAGRTRTLPLLIELGLSSNDMDRARAPAWCCWRYTSWSWAVLPGCAWCSEAAAAKACPRRKLSCVAKASSWPQGAWRICPTRSRS